MDSTNVDRLMRVDELRAFVEWVQSQPACSVANQVAEHELAELARAMDLIRTGHFDVICGFLDNVVRGRKVPMERAMENPVTWRRMKNLLFGKYANMVYGDVIFPTGTGGETAGINMMQAGKGQNDAKRSLVSEGTGVQENTSKAVGYTQKGPISEQYYGSEVDQKLSGMDDTNMDEDNVLVPVSSSRTNKRVRYE